MQSVPSEVKIKTSNEGQPYDAPTPSKSDLSTLYIFFSDICGTLFKGAGNAATMINILSIAWFSYRRMNKTWMCWYIIEYHSSSAESQIMRL